MDYQFDQKDNLASARGVVLGLLLSVTFWATFAALIAAVK